MGLDQDACNNKKNSSSSGLELVLGLSLTTTPPSTTNTNNNNNNNNNNNKNGGDHLCLNPTPVAASETAEPSLKLCLSGESYRQQQVSTNHQEAVELSRQTSPHSSVVSSFSGGRVVKRERDLSSELEAEVDAAERVSSRASDEEEDGPNARKKLRLTKEQSALLEDSFKQHSTLNPKQKQALARQLNLRPRQVEVWFQNRRARTKLKQTEVDCEFLKKCCETLTEENRRLKKELQELKALKLAHPLYMPMPAATLTMCPSCERLGGDAASNKTPFSIAPKPHFYNPFTNPSAAC